MRDKFVINGKIAFKTTSRPTGLTQKKNMRALCPFIQTFKKNHKMGKIKESFIKIKIFLACSSDKKTNKMRNQRENQLEREMKNLEKPTYMRQYSPMVLFLASIFRLG